MAKRRNYSDISLAWNCFVGGRTARNYLLLLLRCNLYYGIVMAEEEESSIALLKGVEELQFPRNKINKVRGI